MVDLSLINKTANGYELRVVDGSKKHTFELTNLNLAGIIASVSLIIRDGTMIAPISVGGRNYRGKEKARAFPVPVKRGPGRPRKTVSPDPKPHNTEPRRSSRVRSAEKHRVSGRGRVPAPKRK